MKKLDLLIVIILLAASLSVCGGCRNTGPNMDDSATLTEPHPISGMPSMSNAPPTSESPAEETPSVPELHPTPESQKKTIYYIVAAMPSAASDLMGNGVQQASEDFGCGLLRAVVPVEPSERRTEVIAQLFEDAMASRADAIITNIVDREAMAGPVSEAHRAGIPIILLGGMAGTEDYSTCIIVNDIHAGEQAAAEMLRKLKSTGLSEEEPAEIAVQVGLAESQAIINRLEGFKSYWDENAPLQWIVLWDDVKVNEGNYERAVGNGREFLAKYPNLKAFFAPNDFSTEGFAVALKESSRTDITLIGFNLYKEVHELILNEDYSVSAMMFAYKMGYDALAIALELASGGADTEKIVYADVFFVDNENIDDPEVRKWLW